MKNNNNNEIVNYTISKNNFNISINTDNLTVEDITYSDKYQRWYLKTTVKKLEGLDLNISLKIYLTQQQYEKLFNKQFINQQQQQLDNVKKLNLTQNDIQQLFQLFQASIEKPPQQQSRIRRKKTVE